MLSVVPFVSIAAVLFARYMKGLSEEFQKLLATSTGETILLSPFLANLALATAEEALSGIRTVRSFACDDKVKSHYAKDIDASYAVGSTYSLVLGVTPSPPPSPLPLFLFFLLGFCWVNPFVLSRCYLFSCLVWWYLSP